jgi:hypothetical protein
MAMPGDEPRCERVPRGGVALGFAIAALGASWNPIAAPFGLVVGVAAALLGARVLRGAGRRRVPAAAVAVGILATVASVAVLILSAGAVGTDLPGEPIVKGRSRVELDRTLEEAGERTRARRERASGELERLAGKRSDGGAGSRLSGDRGQEGADAAGADRP